MSYNYEKFLEILPARREDAISAAELAARMGTTIWAVYRCIAHGRKYREVETEARNKPGQQQPCNFYWRRS